MVKSIKTLHVARGHGSSDMVASTHSPLATRHPPPIAEVAFNIPLERTFHYLIPPNVQETLQPGMRVVAPFGPRERVGFVLDLLTHSAIRHLKPIRRVLDPIPVIEDERWALARWLCAYYDCSVGEALSAMVPSVLRLTARSAGTMSVVVESPPASVAPRMELSTHQRRALDLITHALKASRSQTILLHGVTGSGKTEVYLRAIETVLRQDRSAICLVPEIALTPQTIDRFRERFGAQVAVWHSALTTRQRAQAWQDIERGSYRIVVGTRSAVFSPVRRMGLVVLDEEHEQTYKQEDTPRYHAREVAQARARLTGAAVVLGSATPSIESYYRATHGPDHLVTLPERVEGRGLPQVEVIDMREEVSRRHRSGPLSARLERAVEQAVERQEQVMLLLNRRGFSRVVQCPSCGAVVRCSQCAVPLVYHADRKELVCHYCNFHRAPEDLCGQCRKGYLRFRGTGTERVESELHRLFPATSIARMDRDTTRSRDSHRQIYDAVKSRQVVLLVGTQMIAKGLDFPEVTLVGVVSADTSLNLPDFRAGERTFNLLTQVAGRAGRGARPGSVLIQTYCPNHYAIQAARHHDYQRFYEEELRMRRRLKLPPFTHLIELTLRGSSRQRVVEAAEVLAETLRRVMRHRRITHAPVPLSGVRKDATPVKPWSFTLLGPAPHRIPRLRRAYQICLLLKGASVEPMVGVLRKALSPGRRFRGMPVRVDVDPL